MNLVKRSWVHWCLVCNYPYFGEGSLALSLECFSQINKWEPPKFPKGSIVTRKRYRRRKDPPKYKILDWKISYAQEIDPKRKKVVDHVYLYAIQLLSNPNVIHKVMGKDLVGLKE